MTADLAIRDLRIGGEAGLGGLPADLPLQGLAGDNLPRSRNLLGVARWPELVRVACSGLPALARLTFAASFLDLRRVDVDDVGDAWHLGGSAIAAALGPAGVEVRVDGRLVST